MAQNEQNDMGAKLNNMLSRFQNISEFAVTQEGEAYCVIPQVSPRIKEPARRYQLQLQAITKLAICAKNAGVDTDLLHRQPEIADHFALEFPSAEALGYAIFVFENESLAKRTAHSKTSGSLAK